MINLYPYLCLDPDMDLTPIREKSERLYHDILRERQFYNQHPGCDNIHFFHMVKQNSQSSYWVDRWGMMVLAYKRNKWYARRLEKTNSPAMRKNYCTGYLKIRSKIVGGDFIGLYMHNMVGDVFLPNTDFTKCQMDHLNSEHLDNNALNLERVTPEENQRRKNCGYYTKRGLPVPEKFRTPENYLIYLQSKNSPSPLVPPIPPPLGNPSPP